MPGAALGQGVPPESEDSFWPSNWARPSLWSPGDAHCACVGSSLSVPLVRCTTTLSRVVGTLQGHAGCSEGRAGPLEPACRAVLGPLGRGRPWLHRVADFAERGF